MRAPDEIIDRLMHDLGLGLQPPADSPDEFVSREIGLAEVIPTPRSEYLGKRVALGQIADRFPVQLLAVRRRGQPVADRELTLEFGDSLLVRGTWEAIGELQSDRRNFIVVGTPEAMASEVAGLLPRAGLAVAALGGMVVLMVTGVVSTVIAALIAAAAMILGGCLSTRDAYRSISWSSVVLIAAMIPMGRALEITGGASLVAEGLVNTLGYLSPVALMAGVFVLTTGFSQVINNTATAVFGRADRHTGRGRAGRVAPSASDDRRGRRVDRIPDADRDDHQHPGLLARRIPLQRLLQGGTAADAPLPRGDPRARTRDLTAFIAEPSV